ncbi:LPS-assembly protein LptD [Pontivivens ytuae]|uniref:LPS-assembly protein LptD n=1 Tax=Pontivivens ytuae TaxID=2789856 RepID=A0A7S9LRI3_9RHOB|nr:LPS assembly protein LptD [Pontivivens ytuae]QPH53907.1 LPS-assembly protein LptD [Pontivivens ytuae]
MRRLFLPLILLISPIFPGAAQEVEQERVALIADRVSVDQATGNLIAEGDVTILRGETVLTTDRLIYDRAAGQVRVPGQLILQSDEVGGVVYADFAELDEDLQNGVAEGARAIIDNQLQVAATSLQQIDGRLTVLNRTTASSCVICEENPTPIWQIRAERVVRDAEQLRFYYENAVFELFGVPVLYLPYFSHFDPSVRRATGFLNPELRSSGEFGSGVRIPYFYVIDDSRDATLTPFVTTDAGVLLEGEYRQRFMRGSIDLGGTLKLQSDEVGDDRGFLFARGDYDFGDDIIGRIDGIAVSDDAFLDSFGYSSADRLTSTLSLERFQTGRFWRVSSIYFDSLRDNEPQETVPFILPEAEFRRTYALGEMRADLTATALSFTRDDGRDVSRTSLGAGFDRTIVTDPGLVLRGFADFGGDLYYTADDPAVGSDTDARVDSTVGFELRYPFVSRNAGLTQVIEPIIQIVRGDQSGDPEDVANEDSLLVELDETNLFSTNRFPGSDRFETGTYANLGLRYESITPRGRNITGTIGRVVREEALDTFPGSTTLGQEESDYVLAAGFDATRNTRISGSLLADDDFVASRTELRFAYGGERLGFSGTYVFLREDEITPEDRAELVFDASYQIDGNWQADVGFRRDIENSDFIRVDAAVSWGNECATFEFSASRRFTRRDNVEPSTDFGLTLRLAGIGESALGTRRREQICGT